MSFSAKVFVLRSMGHAPVGLSFNKGSNAVYHKRSLRSASIRFSKKAGGRLALSLYVFLPTVCFHFELLELVNVDLF